MIHSIDWPYPLRIISGMKLQAWLNAQPGLANYYIISRPALDCTGESRFTARVDIEDDAGITTDPSTLARRDVVEYQRGYYHHVYISDVLTYAWRCGLVNDRSVLVIYEW